MILEIASEREVILQQITIVQRIGSHMPQTIKSIREITQLRTILRLIEKHLDQLQQLSKEELQVKKSTKIYPYVQANTRIKNHVVRKGLQIKQMIQSQAILPYVNLALKSLSKIVFSLESIGKKVKETSEFVSEYLSLEEPFHKSMCPSTNFQADI